MNKYVWKSAEAVFKKIKGLNFSQKMMLRELILHINALTNRMEDASDRLDIVSVETENMKPCRITEILRIGKEKEQ